MALNQGVVTLHADLTSAGTATNVTAATLVSPETTVTAKTTLAALAVGALQKINVEAQLVVGSFPTKSFVLAGDTDELTIPAAASNGFADAFVLTAQAGDTSRRQWVLDVTPYVVTGGTGVKYELLAEEPRIAWDALLEPTMGSMTLAQIIALAVENSTVAKPACLVLFDQGTNKLTVGYGSEANMETYKVALDAANGSITADKEVIGFDFEDVVVIAGTTSGFLE
jgi:hypothetical protein